MRSNVVETLVGAFVLGVAALFLGYAYKSSGSLSGKGYHLQARFDRIDGLTSGNDVKLSGVKVGDVDSIKVDPDTFLAVVTMTIDNSLKLPVDTSVEIVSESLMGGKYLALVPGAAEETLADGAVITNTQSSISFESMIGKFLFSKPENPTVGESTK